MSEAREPANPLIVSLAWIEVHCVVPDNDMRGEFFALTNEQVRFLANHYDVKPDADPSMKGSAFVFRRSQLVRPQKWGKSPLTAAMICLEGTGPALFDGWAEEGDAYKCSENGCGCGWEYAYDEGEPKGRLWMSPIVQITASSEEQTANVYQALRPMIELGPLSSVVLSVGEEFIRLPNDGRIDTVTSSSKSRLGQRVTFCVQDETGTWLTAMRKVADTQRRGLAGMDGRSVETTNAWDPAERSVAQTTAESKASDVYRDHLLASLKLDYSTKKARRRVHEIVYGDSSTDRGGWVNLDSIEKEAAELCEYDQAQAERFFGNRIVSGNDAWWSNGVVAKFDEVEQDLEVPKGAQIVLGFDGSQYDDWTALRARWVDTPDGVPYAFTPIINGAPTIWNPAEHNGETPRQEVLSAVDYLYTQFEVKRFYCDPPLWQSEVDAWSAKYPGTVFAFPTYRPKEMSFSLERLLTDTTNSKYTHDGCEITRQHLINARKLRRGANTLIGKPEQHRKIDAAMADVLAHEALNDYVKSAAKKVKKPAVLFTGFF